MRQFRHLFLCITLLLVVMWPTKVLNAQASSAPVQCGTIIEAELTANDLNQNNHPVHTYGIRLNAGDKITVIGQRIGDFLDFGVGINGIQGTRLTEITHNRGKAQIDVTVPSNGSYLVYIWGYGSNNVGVYDITFGCTLRDGTVIAPGDAPQSIQPTEQPPIPTELPANFLGFPGLAPVDFSAVAKIPMIANVPMTGAVAADGNIILGYTLDAAANDTLTLSFTRLSGNLNLGLVVLSADNKVVFQASLVTSSELTTTFTLPTAGQYTIGVFRIDLLPPPTPEPTAFQLQAVLNP